MRTLSPWIAGVAVAAMIVLGVMLDRAGAPADGQTAPATEPAPPATSGAWFCAAGDTDGDRGLTVTAAAPPSEGGRPAEVLTSRFREGGSTDLDRLPVFPSSSATVGLEPGLAQIGVSVRWWGWPAAVTRVWQLPGGETPPGTVAGPCVSETSDTWIIPGVATAGGATARIELANPYDADAAVSVTLATPDGIRAPRLLENVTVPKRSTRTISVNEHVPAEPDLGVIVTTRSGRVVVEGIQFLDAAIGGVDGAALAAAAPAAAETWTIPSFGSGGAATESWLWVTNPGDEPAAVILSVHTEDGGVVPETADNVVVEPGRVRRVDLRGIVEADAAGVTVSSDNGVPIVVAAATRVGGTALDENGGEDGGEGDGADEATQTGFSVQLGVPGPTPEWVVTLPSGADRASELHLVNPGGAEAVVDVTLWAGAGVLRPDEAQGVGVPPGAVRVVDLGGLLPDVPEVTAFVIAREGDIVAGGRSARGSGPLGLVAYPGISTSMWEGADAIPPVRYRPGLARRLGTELGIDHDGPGREHEQDSAPAAPTPSPG